MVRKTLRSFLRRDQGSVTIEFVLWLPVLFALVLLTADTSLLFLRHSNFLTISRDAARVVARHGLDAEAAQDWAAEQARIGDYRPEVTVRIDPVADTVTVSIRAEAGRIAPFGMIRFALDDRVGAAVTLVREPI